MPKRVFREPHQVKPWLSLVRQDWSDCVANNNGHNMPTLLELDIS